MTDILFTNVRLIDPSQNLDASGQLAITDGVISAVDAGTADSNSAKADKVIDCRGACIAPGLVDMRVQTADPGSEHLEDLATLLAAAAAGGITGLGCLPNTQPVIDNAAMIDSAWPAGISRDRTAPAYIWRRNQGACRHGNGRTRIDGRSWCGGLHQCDSKHRRYFGDAPAACIRQYA